jgi:hypothetical protein
LFDVILTVSLFQAAVSDRYSLWTGKYSHVYKTASVSENGGALFLYIGFIARIHQKPTTQIFYKAAEGNISAKTNPLKMCSKVVVFSEPPLVLVVSLHLNNNIKMAFLIKQINTLLMTFFIYYLIANMNAQI